MAEVQVPVLSFISDNAPDCAAIRFYPPGILTSEDTRSRALKVLQDAIKQLG